MKIFLTGADGMLGDSFITAVKSKKYSIFALSRSSNNKPYTKGDITNHELIKKYILEFRPDIILHFAALTNVDYAENHPEETYEVNTKATKHLTDLAKKLQIPIVFISTGAVFSGSKKTSYIESDKTGPVNVYGHSKLKAEKYVQKYPNHIIIRAGWLIGGNKKDKKFVSKILDKINSNDSTIKAVSDVYGSPTLTTDLAEAIAQLIEFEAKGIFHVTNLGSASRYEIAKEVIDLMGKNNSIKLEPVPFGYFNEVALRPKQETLNNSKLLETYNINLGSWKKSLKKYLKNLNK